MAELRTGLTWRREEAEAVWCARSSEVVHLIRINSGSASGAWLKTYLIVQDDSRHRVKHLRAKDEVYCGRDCNCHATLINNGCMTLGLFSW